MSDQPGLDEGIERAARRKYGAARSSVARKMAVRLPRWDDAPKGTRERNVAEVRPLVDAAYQPIFDAGVAEGRRAEFLEKSLFIQCPECPAAIHVPLVGIITGEAGEDQTIAAEPNTTELWMHMDTHRGG